MSLAGATQDEVRRHNVASLLRLLHVLGSCSRSDLTALTGLNRSTVGALTSELVDVGLVEESAPVGRGGAGRPSIVVALQNHQHAYVLAIDVGVDHLIVARVGLGGRVLDRRELRRAPGPYAPSVILGEIAELAQAVLASAEAGSTWVGVGAAVTGVVRHSDGLVRLAPNLEWVDVPFGALLAETLNTSLPVTVGNEADLGAVAEHTRGAAAGVRNAIFLSGEIGLGGGIILDDALMNGAGGYGGEIGHMVVNPNGRVCRCGSRGCWETEVGAMALVLAAGLADGGVEGVLAAVALGDAQAKAALRRFGRWLGIGIANLVNIFNPDVIVFGGALRHLLPATESVVREKLAFALTAPREQVRLVLPQLGADAALLGAAESAFALLLDDPLGTLARARAAFAVR